MWDLQVSTTIMLIENSPVSSGQLLTKRAARLLLQPPAELTATEQETVQMLRQIHPHVEVVDQRQNLTTFLYIDNIRAL